MKLSTISRYGYRAIIELAKRGNKGAVSLKEIARAQNIPYRYLENIMARLVAGGIVESARGRGGGFKLKKDPDELTIFDVINTLENTLTPLPCIDDKNTCERFETCGARDFLEEAYLAFVNVLKSHTIKEAAEKEKQKIKEILEKNEV